MAQYASERELKCNLCKRVDATRWQASVRRRYAVLGRRNYDTS